MSELDEELAQAVAASEAANDGNQSPKTQPSQTNTEKRRSVGLLVSLLVIAGAVLALVLSAEGEEIYSLKVDKVVDDLGAWEGRNIRVQGILVSGSLAKRDQPCEYRFKIGKEEKVLPIRYAQCTVPDTFRDVRGVDVEVTAEGRLSQQGSYLEASKIIAKCPSKYEMKQAEKAAGARPEHQKAFGMASEPATLLIDPKAAPPTAAPPTAPGSEVSN